MKKIISLFALSLLLLPLGACTQTQYVAHLAKTLPKEVSRDAPRSKGTFKVGNPYKIEGRWYYPQESYDRTETGIASWYGPGFNGKKTANGEIFDKTELTAAHRTLQMPSLVRVTNLDNGRSVIVRVNDRGPYAKGRVIDVSEKAAELLGFKHSGTAKVKLQVLEEESVQVAQMAKEGLDTRGFELAFNDTGGSLAPRQQPQPYKVASASEDPSAYLPAVQPVLSSPTAMIEPVSSEMLTTPAGNRPGPKTIIPGRTVHGNFYPDPVVTEYPVTSSQIYVQAGAFSSQDNAIRLSRELSAFENAQVYPALINGRQFYRVRLGPVASVPAADKVLARLADAGYDDVMITVD